MALRLSPFGLPQGEGTLQSWTLPSSPSNVAVADCTVRPASSLEGSEGALVPIR